MCACTAVLDQHISTALPGTYVDVCTLPGRCTERPTAMFLDAYWWKLTFSELALRSDDRPVIFSG